MIADTWSNFSLYAPLFPTAWPLISRFMAEFAKGEMTAGSRELSGKLLKANVMDMTTKPESAAVLEIHHQYIDLQTNIGGNEQTYCRSARGLAPRAEFNDADDYQLFDFDRQGTVPVLLDGSNFVVYFPNEAHAGGIVPAGACPASFKKIVFKIDVSLLAK